jgi:hypothetical protein
MWYNIENELRGQPMDRLRTELYIINRALANMSRWAYLTDDDEQMKKELEKRKKFLEFLIENA